MTANVAFMEETLRSPCRTGRALSRSEIATGSDAQPTANGGLKQGRCFDRDEVAGSSNNLQDCIVFSCTIRSAVCWDSAGLRAPRNTRIGHRTAFHSGHLRGSVAERAPAAMRRA